MPAGVPERPVALMANNLLFAGATVALVGAIASEKSPPTTSRSALALSRSETDSPFTLNVERSPNVALEAASVSVELSPAWMVAGLKLPVTPMGSESTPRVIVSLLSPVTTTLATVKVVVPLGVMKPIGRSNISEKTLVPIATVEIALCWVAPAVPVMVMLVIGTFAAAMSTCSVSVLDSPGLMVEIVNV